MEQQARELPPSAVYPEDVVRVAAPDGSHSYALVVRCAQDESPEMAEEAARRGIPFIPLEPGHLELIHPSGITTIVRESEVTVTDRGFLSADVVRRSGGKGQAGLITKLDTRVELVRVLSNEPVEGTFDAKEVIAASRVARGDHVVYNDWIGMVEETFEMALVETKSGPPRRVCDSGSTLTVGATSENFFLGALSPPTENAADLLRVLDVQLIMIAVNWLCTNQRGAPPSYDRPKRYWTELDQLSLSRATADHLHSIADKVVFRDPSAHPLPPHLAASPYASGHQVCVVTNSTTTVEVLWQDGTTSTGPASDFEHCVNIDEEVDAFPGDVGVFSGCTPPRVAVVQAMNSKKRTVALRWYGEDSGEVETVSGLEFDQHGPPPEVYGVRRADCVLITKEGEINGLPIPTVPRLGESEVATGAFPAPVIVRAEISQMGLRHVALTGEDLPTLLPKTDPASLSSINWVGEVCDLLTDGRVTVRFPSGAKESFPLDRIYLLDDGLGHGEGGPEDEMMEEDAESAGSWETDEEGGEEMPGGLDWGDREADEQDAEMSESEAGGWAEEETEGSKHGLEVKEIILSDEKKGEEKAPTAGVSMPAELEDDENWKRFVMLEEAPQDHHYAVQTPTAPSKAFMARVQKEHNVLSTSLPPNILVRAYEDRADLLRCLIIGPLGTPFANAPFLFDVYLPPTKFPAEPPQVHFHSWCGGTRVSPNLYAEGKVCLSLLGTWNGDKTESWSAGRSSILQVFVSIQALIMTENPYYSEPGFEKQQGTAEGTAASDLYNERTLVLTRAFVKRACEFPPKDFEAEVRAYYYSGLPTTGPGALKGIVEQAKALLVESEGVTDDRPESKVLPGMRVLTEGAALSLKRTLAGLEPLLSRA